MLLSIWKSLHTLPIAVTWETWQVTERVHLLCDQVYMCVCETEISHATTLLSVMHSFILYSISFFQMLFVAH